MSELRTKKPFLALRCSPTESRALRVAAPLPTPSAGSSTASNKESCRGRGKEVFNNHMEIHNLETD